MNKYLLVLAGVAVFGATAHAEQNAAPAQATRQQGMAMCGGSMGSGCQMPAMVEVMKLERKLAAGVPAGQKKALLAEIDKKIAALETAAAAMPCASTPGMKSGAMPCMPAQPQAAPQSSASAPGSSTMTMNMPCCPEPNAVPATKK